MRSRCLARWDPKAVCWDRSLSFRPKSNPDSSAASGKRSLAPTTVWPYLVHQTSTSAPHGAVVGAAASWNDSRFARKPGMSMARRMPPITPAQASKLPNPCSGVARTPPEATQWRMMVSAAQTMRPRFSATYRRRSGCRNADVGRCDGCSNRASRRIRIDRRSTSRSKDGLLAVSSQTFWTGIHTVSDTPRMRSCQVVPVIASHSTPESTVRLTLAISTASGARRRTAVSALRISSTLDV